MKDTQVQNPLLCDARNERFVRQQKMTHDVVETHQTSNESPCDSTEFIQSVGNMNDIISVFSGIKPKPVAETEWRTVIENIRTGKYRQAIETGRSIKDPVAYREFKKRLPSVTFCAKFKDNRDMQHVVSATGLILADLDHLPDVENIFNLLKQDPHVVFIFRSPSGVGLKVAVRSEGITEDQDIKRLFAAFEHYLWENYQLKIDPACKDISRLTFVSYDPDLYLNENPALFDIEKWEEQKPEPVFYIPSDTGDKGWQAKYGQKVLEFCCQQITTSMAGFQHGVRLKMARLVGGYIASGYIEESQAISALEQAVISSGANRVQDSMKTVRDGIEDGKKHPLQPEPRPESMKKDDIQYKHDEIDGFCPHCPPLSTNEKSCPHLSTKNGFCPHLSTTCPHFEKVDNSKKDNTGPNTDEKAPQNLSSVIRDWIMNSSGSFTVDQLDRDLVLTTRKEKQYRAKCLTRCTEKKLIKKDKRGAGKFHIINSKLDVINLDNIDEKPFDLKLPFELHRFTSIPQKAVIVITGSTNAGKTVLILNILKLNLLQAYKKMYLMSEMGRGEYAERLRKFDDIQFSNWKNVCAAERTCDFDGAIENHNKDGLTCVDFLEEIEGEYFKIATDIRSIYDALGDGVAIVAIQKKTDTDYARGGQATAEKARLYLSVDLVTVLDHCIICALKIVKNKRYVNRNLQGHEIHFKIHRGSKIEPISDWMRSSDVDRNKFRVKYEKENRSADTHSNKGKPIKMKSTGGVYEVVL